PWDTPRLNYMQCRSANVCIGTMWTLPSQDEDVAVLVGERAHEAARLIDGLLHERHAVLAQLLVRPLDVVALEDDSRGRPDAILHARRRPQGERRLTSRRQHFD